MRMQSQLLVIAIANCVIAQEEHYYLSVSWNRSLLGPLQNNSDDAKMLASMFSSEHSGNCIGQITINQTCLQLQVSDGSKSNFTQRIFFMFNLSLTTLPDTATRMQNKQLRVSRISKQQVVVGKKDRQTTSNNLQ